MKITVEWLKDFVSTPASPEEIGETLTMLGLELEDIEESELGPVLNFKVTPNRGDCLSILGISRELVAKNPQTFRPTEHMAAMVSGNLKGDEDKLLSSLQVSIDAPQFCSRYAARQFTNVTLKPSSEKLQRRLTACGMRPINVVVDATNAVMLELGQPLHAFDSKKIDGNHIVIRTAGISKSFVTLDGQKKTLDQDMLMICDAVKPIALAGIMGGENSEVTESTTSIILESAHFEPASIRATRKKLGMNTEASYRFERYVDPNGVVCALNRFSEILFSETGIEPTAGIIDVNAKRHLNPEIQMRANKCNQLLGMTVPIENAETILNHLGFETTINEDTIVAIAPSWRSDIHREEDLIEEIGRVYGYEHIPELPPSGITTVGKMDAFSSFKEKTRQLLFRLRFTEILSHTLTGNSTLSSEYNQIELRNPGSAELSLLRNSLLPGLAICSNKNRGHDLAIFEVGSVFEEKIEFASLGILMHGTFGDSHWENQSAHRVDFYSIKGVVESIAKGLQRDYNFVESTDNRFHPSRRAMMLVFGDRVGTIGQLHPDICKEHDLPRDTIAADLNLDMFFKGDEHPNYYQPISIYPSMRRDLAIAVPISTPYSDIEDIVRKSAGELLETISVFDKFQGKGIEPGFQSIAISIVLRRNDRTLTDNEANQLIENVWSEISKLGGKPRV